MPDFGRSISHPEWLLWGWWREACTNRPHTGWVGGEVLSRPEICAGWGKLRMLNCCRRLPLRWATSRLLEKKVSHWDQIYTWTQSQRCYPLLTWEMFSSISRLLSNDLGISSSHRTELRNAWLQSRLPSNTMSCCWFLSCRECCSVWQHIWCTRKLF